jgi:hypothetical protein
MLVFNLVKVVQLNVKLDQAELVEIKFCLPNVG